MPIPSYPVAPQEAHHILLLEDDEGLRRSLHLMLRAYGFNISAYADANVLLADPAIADAALLIADYRLEGTDGVEVLLRLRGRGWLGPAILITAFATPEISAMALTAGYSAVLEKSLRPNQLVRAISAVLAPAQDLPDGA